jgi:hypothetical protein
MELNQAIAVRDALEAANQGAVAVVVAMTTIAALPELVAHSGPAISTTRKKEEMNTLLCIIVCTPELVALALMAAIITCDTWVGGQSWK